jgi:hypothetical protein
VPSNESDHDTDFFIEGFTAYSEGKPNK